MVYAQGMAIKDTLGYKAHTKARTTGTTVLLCDSEAQGLDSESEGGKYLLVCEGKDGDAHGGCLNVDDSVTARYLLRHPEEWCPYCQGEADPYGAL